MNSSRRGSRTPAGSLNQGGWTVADFQCRCEGLPGLPTVVAVGVGHEVATSFTYEGRPLARMNRLES